MIASVPGASSSDHEGLWIRRGAAGDRQALGMLVRRNQDAVYRVLLRWTGERELALDLCQETFVRAFAALGRFRAGAPVRPWLLRIAHNLFIDHVRAHRREELADPEAWERGSEDPAITGTAARLDVAAALALLPVPWRQAVVLRHLDDLSYDQIAEVLEVPLGTAKTWLFRGRERLRELLCEGGNL